VGSEALRRIGNPDRIVRVAEQVRSDGSRRRASGRSGISQPNAEGAGQSAGERPDRRTRQHRGRSERPEPKLQRRGDRQRREASQRTAQPTQSAPPGLTRRRNEPPIPEGVDSRSLHASVRAELRSLPKDLAEIVAAHLVVAGSLIDDDPQQAYSHAEAARRRAARLPIVREAAAETAYAAGLYDVALTEFRALRRMTAAPDYLPVMADCERALGRPHNALKLAREADRAGLDPALRIEMIIVEAGARRDLGQDHESLRILERAVDRARPESVPPLAAARVRYAYADALLAAGRESEARHWFASAAKLDHDHDTDAQQRTDELDGFLIDYDEGDEVDAESPHEPARETPE
jgi:tetratricopeptide (TPR) repeat protein